MVKFEADISMRDQISIFLDKFCVELSILFLISFVLKSITIAYKNSNPPKIVLDSKKNYFQHIHSLVYFHQCQKVSLVPHNTELFQAVYVHMK